MALSKLMASNSDPPQHHSDIKTSDHRSTNTYTFVTMDDLLENIYSDSLSLEPFPSTANATSLDANARVSTRGSLSMPKKTVDLVWKEIVTGEIDQARGTGGGADEGMTLEDFLSKAGVREDGIGVEAMSGVGGFSVDSSIISGDDGGGGTQFPSPSIDGSIIRSGNGIDGSDLVIRSNGGVGRGGRGKRRAVEEPADKVTQQKQRRMIKNRESAARSRERKQAYAMELESLVTQLEEENAKLRGEKADESKKRFKQLMEKLIPVVEKKKQPRTLLRRIHSMEW